MVTLPSGSGQTSSDVLAGGDGLARLVAVEISGDAEVLIYQRDGDRVDAFTRPFSPWLIVPESAEGFVRNAASIERLRGDGHFAVRHGDLQGPGSELRIGHEAAIDLIE